MIKLPYRIALLSSGILSLFVPAAAYAQDQAATNTNEITDIVVTARRHEESLQNVPIAVTVLSSTQLENKGLRSTEDLRSFIPGLNVGGQRRDDAQFFLRGQGPGVQQVGQRNFSSVATYFAEVPTAVAGPGVFYDIGSVQVLKGPQGTLFGRNTTGGAVLFEPNRPVQRNEGYAQLTYGNYDYKQLEAMLNVAIVPDSVALRVAGQVSRRDGFTRSVLTGQKLDGRKYEAFRASLLLTPTPSIESLTIVDYRFKDNSGTSAILRSINPGATLGATTQNSPVVTLLTGVPVGTSFPIRAGGAVSIGCLSAALPGCPTGPFGNAIAAYAAAYNGGNFSNVANSGFALVAPTSTQLAILARQQALGVRKNLSPRPLQSRSLDVGFTNKSSIDVSDDVTLKNIIAYRINRSKQTADFDGTQLETLENLPVNDQPWIAGSEQFTEEFQVQGKLPSLNASYIAGFYHEFTKPGFTQVSHGLNFGAESYRFTNNRDVSNALFAHLEWNPTELVSLSGGVRKSWDKRRASLSLTNGARVCTQAIPGTSTIQCPLEYTANFDAVTYDATVTLKPARGLLTYVSYRKGYKSGGVNLPAPDAPPPLDPAAFQRFGAETVRSVEVGLKADFDVGVPVRFNAAAFYDRYDNIQLSQTVTYTPVGSSVPQAIPLVQNNVNAKNKGVELEATIVPFALLNLSGFASYIDAAPSNTLPGVSIKGRQFAQQPKWKVGVAANVSVPIPEKAGKVDLSVDYAWQSSTYLTPTPALVDVNPGYGLVNARLEWANVYGKGFDLAVFGTNLTDKTYVLGGYPILSLGFESVFYGEPRMYGGSLKVHF